MVFENVRGKPSTVEIYSVTGTFGLTQKEERKQWLDENWWIWLIVAYVVVGIVIGMLCGVYVGAEFGEFDEDFWLSLACGLFWPIGGIVLLVNYIKEKKKNMVIIMKTATTKNMRMNSTTTVIMTTPPKEKPQ